MGNMTPGNLGGQGQKKKEDKKPIKKPDPSLVNFGKKRKKKKGVEIAAKLPNGILKIILKLLQMQSVY
jgi:hypothetical protein